MIVGSSTLNNICRRVLNHDAQPASREGRFAAMPLAPLTSTLGICRLNLESFFACADIRLPNRLPCASAGSVCVTWLPALISSQGRYAKARASDRRSRDASRGFVVVRVSAAPRRRCAFVKAAVC